MPKTSSFLQKQKIVLGVVAAIVIAILAYMSTLLVKDAPLLGDFVEGEHYSVLPNPRRVRSDKVEVMEFFSYACPHCYSFDPELMDWVEDNEANVQFVRTPAVGSEYWRLLGRNYYTMETLGIVEDQHMAFFREIHDVKRQFASPELLARYFDGRGTTEAEFQQTYNSPIVTQKLEAADAMGRRLQIVSVPSVVIHGKYMVRVTRNVGPARMLDVMDHLVEKVEAERLAAEKGTADTGA